MAVRDFVAAGLMVALLAGCSSSEKPPEDPPAYGMKPNSKWKGEGKLDGAKTDAQYSIGSHTNETERTLGRDIYPEVVNAGRSSYIYFSANREGNHYDIYRKMLDGTQLLKVTSMAGDEYWPRISPDGRYLAFGSNSRGNWDIMVADLQRNDIPPQRVTSNTGDDIHPTWSPDGKRLVFSSFSASMGDFVLSFVEFGAVGMAKSDSDTGSKSGSFGDMLAFSSLPSSPVSNSSAIDGGTGTFRTVTMQGHIMTKLGQPLTGIHPDFRPRSDSSMPYEIVYQDYRRADGNWYGLKVFNWGTGQLWHIAHNESFGSIQPRWSPDGDAIVYVMVKRDADEKGIPVGGHGFGIMGPKGERLCEMNNPTSHHTVSDPVWVKVDGRSQLFFSGASGKGKEGIEIIISAPISLSQIK